MMDMPQALLAPVSTAVCPVQRHIADTTQLKNLAGLLYMAVLFSCLYTICNRGAVRTLCLVCPYEVLFLH